MITRALILISALIASSCSMAGDGDFDLSKYGGKTETWSQSEQEPDAGATEEPSSGCCGCSLSVAAFGAIPNDGIDDALAAQACLTAAKTGSRVCFPRGLYNFASGLTVAAGKVGIDFGGSTLDFGAMSSGVALTFVNEAIDPNDQVGLNAACEYRNGYLLGNANITGISIADTAHSFISNLRFINGGMRNFGLAVEFGEGSFCHHFSGWSFVANVDAIRILPTYNSGERISFEGCMFVNNSGTAIDAVGGAAGGIKLVNCSLDYNGKLANVAATVVSLESCHIESGRDDGYWFTISGDNSHLIIGGGSQIVMSQPKSAFEIFHNTASNGGLSLTDTHFCLGPNAYSLPALCAGNGRTDIHGNTHERYSAKPVTAASSNLIAFGDLEDPLSLNEWSTFGPTTPVLSTAMSHSGTHCALIAGVATGNNGMVASAPAERGRYYAATLVYQGTLNASTFFVLMEYLSAGGTRLDACYFANTADSSAWQRVHLAPQMPAPAGTKSVRLTVNVFGVITTSTCYVDDVWMTEL